MTAEIRPTDSEGPGETATNRFSAVWTTLGERSWSLFAAFLLIAGGVLIVALLTVHHRQQQELTTSPGATRSHIVLSNWLKDGYFHYCGMINRRTDQVALYRNSTGGYMVSGFIVEKLYSALSGHYSYRLLAVHNQFVSMIISALAGLLSYRLARRFGLDARLAFFAGASVVAVVFTFPDELDLYWEMSAQAYALLFALLYLVIEERCVDLAERPRAVLIAQGVTVFLMAVMESIVALGFIASVAITLAILRRNDSWKRFFIVLVLPCFAALALYQLQIKAATVRLGDVPTSGSEPLWRTGLDGESTYYGNHLGIITRRDVARHGWPKTGQYLFDWSSVFVLGAGSVLALFIAFIRGRAPRIALEALIALTGAWFFYAAVFSQAIVIHPYLYDVLLFTPLCIALFALAPSLLESLTARTGVIIMVVVFSAIWYSFFQLRLYALRWPLPQPTAAATNGERAAPRPT
jgi:uncharacterized membrane protein (UPF0136 family)